MSDTPKLTNETVSGDASLFSAPVKWEQNRLTHSFGKITVTATAVEYVPGKVSFLSTAFSIPRDRIVNARKRDNFLWRGAVILKLNEPVHDRMNYIFFLGGRYGEFIALLNQE